MADLPTRTDRHGREVVDGSKITEVTLVVVIGGVCVRLSCDVADVEGQPVDVLAFLACGHAADLIESAHYECETGEGDDA